MLILHGSEKLELVIHQVMRRVGQRSLWLHDVQLCWIGGTGGTAERSGGQAELTPVLSAKRSGLCESLPSLALLGTDTVQ